MRLWSKERKDGPLKGGPFSFRHSREGGNPEKVVFGKQISDTSLCDSNYLKSMGPDLGLQFRPPVTLPQPVSVVHELVHFNFGLAVTVCLFIFIFIANSGQAPTLKNFLRNFKFLFSIIIFLLACYVSYYGLSSAISPGSFIVDLHPAGLGGYEYPTFPNGFPFAHTVIWHGDGLGEDWVPPPRMRAPEALLANFIFNFCLLRLYLKKSIAKSGKESVLEA